MRAKLTFPLSVAFAAAFAAQIEGMMVTRWASDRGSACSASSPAGACSLNGIVSFIAYHVSGVREHGVKYVKQFLGSVVFLMPLMLVVELFSHAFRPVSLGIRLFANLFADHEVVTIFTSLTKS